MSAAASTVTQLRAPRLTDSRLADLELVLKSLDDEIEFLADAWPAYAEGSELRAKLKDRHDSLQRGRVWMAGKIEVERARRALAAGVQA